MPPKLSPAWNLQIHEQSVLCTAGPDEVHRITELSDETLATVQSWLDAGTVELEGATDEVTELTQFLTAIGAISATGDQESSIEWVTVGPSGPAEIVRRNVERHQPTGFGSITVVVRTGGTLADLSERAGRIVGPHVLIDLTGHHTLSVGPYVVPNLTACLGCYAGRLAERWSDTEVAAEPEVQRWSSTAADLLTIQLGLIASATSPLVNATINWDLRSGRSDADALLRYSACARCQEHSTGSLPLPWATEQTPDRPTLSESTTR